MSKSQELKQLLLRRIPSIKSSLTQTKTISVIIYSKGLKLRRESFKMRKLKVFPKLPLKKELIMIITGLKTQLDNVGAQ